jgi:uncharacterized integral membrane protein
MKKIHIIKPCKKCLVRAACTQDCDELERYWKVIFKPKSELVFLTLMLIIVISVVGCSYFVTIKAWPMALMFLFSLVGLVIMILREARN